MPLPKTSALKRLLDLPHGVGLLGILNLTPDSFSDGGKFLNPAAAVRRMITMEQEGASGIDIGAESTRPGSKPVRATLQLKRILPVLRNIRKKSAIPVSIDTQSAEVAAACLTEGADIINDVSAGRRDTKMLPLIAKSRCTYIMMHMLGTPETMQKDPKYKDVVREIIEFFRERLSACDAAGIDLKEVIVDPGIGFGKTFDHNIELLRGLRAFKLLKRPIMIGVSRKSLLGRMIGEDDPTKRVTASVAAGIAAVANGAQILRVHDVREHAEALHVVWMLHRKTARQDS